MNAHLLFFSGNSSHRLSWNDELSHLAITLCDSVHVTLHHKSRASIQKSPVGQTQVRAETRWHKFVPSLAISVMTSFSFAQFCGPCRREPPFSFSSLIYFFLRAVTAALQTHLTGLERITLSPAQFSLDACFSVSLAKQKNSNTCTN